MSDTEEKPITNSKQRSVQRSSLLKIALEVFSIVLGVLLALAVSEWAQDRENQAQAQSALLNVVNEIRVNLEILEIIHQNNVDYVAVIEASLPEGEVARNLIPGAQLQEIAWEAMLSTGLSNFIEYDTILEFSQMYAIQRVYKETFSQLIVSGMNLTAFATALGKPVDEQLYQQQFLGVFQLLVGIEEQLLIYYQDVLLSVGE